MWVFAGAALGLRRAAVGKGSFAFDAGLLEAADRPVTGLEQRASDPELFGREFELSVFIGNPSTRGVIPLKELRLRFCEDQVDAPALASATSRKLEVSSNPWFISMDGTQEVMVSSGAWSLIPMAAPAEGTHFLRFYVDLPDGVFKSDMGLPPRTRLFFGTTLWETEALPALRQEVKHLTAFIDGYDKDLRDREGKNWFQRFRTSVAGYNKYQEAVLALEKIGGIGTPGTSEGVTFGPFTASKEGYVGVQGGREGKQFGQVGTFSIRRGGGLPDLSSTADDRISVSEDRELVSSA
jgi:hypothetical protein